MKYDVGDKIVNIHNNRTYIIAVVYNLPTDGRKIIYGLKRKDPCNMLKSYEIYEGIYGGFLYKTTEKEWFAGNNNIKIENTCIEDLEVNYKHLDEFICDRILND